VGQKPIHKHISVEQRFSEPYLYPLVICHRTPIAPDEPVPTPPTPSPGASPTIAPVGEGKPEIPPTPPPTTKVGRNDDDDGPFGFFHAARENLGPWVNSS